jgi:hypothetical protein
MLPMRARSPLFALAISVAFVLTFILAFIGWQYQSVRVTAQHNTKPPFKIDQQEFQPSKINELIRSLYKPIVVAPTEPFAVEPDETPTELPSNLRYKENMGSDVLIVDLDTRQPKTDQVDWDDVDHVLGGIISHYTYAMAHGYDYKYIHAAQFKDHRQATWIKPSALANLIPDYKFIVFLDADATFRFTHLPIEWLLNHWEIEPHHSIIMAKDPWTEEEPQYNSDRFNRTYTNTGFMIIQNNDNTLPMLKAWHECPDDVRYKGCSEWKTPKFHEQSAFGEYIRYDDEFKDSIKELECREANGFPGVEVSKCQGKFVRHYWFQKHMIKQDYRNNMMNVIPSVMRELFSEHSIMNKFIMPIQKLFSEKTGIVFEQTENVIRS